MPPMQYNLTELSEISKNHNRKQNNESDRN